MSAFLRMLTSGARALLAAIALVHSGSAADQTAANAALLAKYFADVNAQ